MIHERDHSVSNIEGFEACFVVFVPTSIKRLNIKILHYSYQLLIGIVAWEGLQKTVLKILKTQ